MSGDDHGRPRTGGSALAAQTGPGVLASVLQLDQGHGRRPEGGPLPMPPSWASHSVVEDGGVTHEQVSGLHPVVMPAHNGAGTAFSAMTDVALSVFDRPGQHRWIRQPPRIRVAGGSYSIAEARLLIQAMEALIAEVD